MFRSRHQNWEKAMTQGKRHGGRVSQMVWGAFSGLGRSALVVMKGDPEAKGGGVLRSVLVCLEGTAHLLDG